MAAIVYDDTQLRKMFAELDEKNRLKALRGAFRREANNVRKAAVGNLQGSGIRNGRTLGKGIRAIVFRNKAGFRVTIGTKRANKNGKGERGFHKNRQGLKKPVLLWAEMGTNARRTKTQTKVFTRSRKGHNTGRMKSYAFMRKTRDTEAPKVENRLRDEITKSVIRTAKKYGCTT